MAEIYQRMPLKNLKLRELKLREYRRFLNYYRLPFLIFRFNVQRHFWFSLKVAAFFKI